MQRLAIIVSSLALLMSFAACKRCKTCSLSCANDPSACFQYDEVCGKKSQLEDYEQACKDAAELSGVTCSCEDT